MSGTVKIDSATAESAISGLNVARDEISQCDGTGPEQVDAGAVTNVVLAALQEVLGSTDELSSGIDGFCSKLRGTVSSFSATDQEVSDGAQALTWKRDKQ
jgi:hypothetical protein